MYKKNPKTKGSGIMCAIPQEGTCPNNCEDCFFQSGRSYLEPLQDNLPNMPSTSKFHVIRVNDGNDSNNGKVANMEMVEQYQHKFYNTAIPNLIFNAPIVLTVNPGKMTDIEFHKIDNPPKNLMFVRFRCNTWNLKLCDEVVEYYSKREVSVVLTFMAYFSQDSFRKVDVKQCTGKYVWRKRTLNSYWAITTEAWRKIMQRYKDNKWVYSCGKIEGEKGDTHCRFCGNCLREYFAALVRINGE